MDNPEIENSYVVFPFLRTTRRVKIGKLEFRSNEDFGGLESKDSAHLKNISNILYLQDNYRIKAFSVAIVPFLDLNNTDLDMESISRSQAFISYIYAYPRHEFGDVFLSHEYASVAILSPQKTSIHSVTESFNVELVGAPASQEKPTQRGHIDGYAGLYNFRHYFWATKNSRIYGPAPRLILNQSQDLSADMLSSSQSRSDSRLLLDLVGKPPREFATRVFTAVNWFNSANSSSNTQAIAIVHLSIAFESLLRLPKGETTDRLVDAVSLLLGRKTRLDTWAKQFYDARSKIVHEGRALQTRFHTAESPNVKGGQLYQSLLSYGRQIFQLCLGTLLTGSDLSDRLGLEDQLVTNQERFARICKLAAKDVKDPSEKWDELSQLILVIEQYLYVPETDLQLATMIAATKRASQALLDLGALIPEHFKIVVKRFVDVPKEADHFSELEALDAVDTAILDESKPLELGCAMAYIVLVRSVWDKVIQHFLWIKEDRAKKFEEGKDSSPIKKEGD